MSEFDKLAGDVEQEAKDHPQQVHEAEQDAEHAVEKKFGDGSGQSQDDDQSQGGNQNQGGDSDQGQGQPDHDQ